MSSWRAGASQHRGHLLDGECRRSRPTCWDFEFSSDCLTFPHYFRRVAHRRRFDLVTAGIQSDFGDAGVVECRSHHIEEPFDVACGMQVFFDAPFGQLLLPRSPCSATGMTRKLS